jgi:hypothetical protein
MSKGMGSGTLSREGFGQTNNIHISTIPASVCRLRATTQKLSINGSPTETRSSYLLNESPKHYSNITLLGRWVENIKTDLRGEGWMGYMNWIIWI